jgi:hypothetical protein
MTAIHVATHHPSAPTALAALGLARALAAAGHHVVVSDGPHRQAVAQALGLDGASPHEVAPRLTFRNDGAAGPDTVQVVDVGASALEGASVDHPLVLVLPAQADAIAALPAAAPSLRGARWMGLVVWDDGAEPELAARTANELSTDVLAPVMTAPPGELPPDSCSEALARVVSERLALVAPAPTSLADLAGLKLGHDAPAANTAQAAQFTFVMEGAALRDAGVVSSPVSVPAAAPRASLQSAMPAIAAHRRFGPLAVITPWVLVVVLAALHVLRS